MTRRLPILTTSFPGNRHDVRQRKIGCSQRGFTLLELLVVIGIIATLLVVVMPAVNSLSKSGGRKAAISLLLGVLEQARSLALKDGRATYVVFPAEFPAGNAATTDPNKLSRYFYHSVAIFEDDPTDLSKPKVQVTEWKILPTGISLRSEISVAAPDPPDPAADSGWAAQVFNFTPTQSNPTFPYLGYNTSGGVDSPPRSSGLVKLRLFEGYVEGVSEKQTNKKNFDEVITISTTSGRAVYTSANP